jgi:hypothetical protein
MGWQVCQIVSPADLAVCWCLVVEEIRLTKVVSPIDLPCASGRVAAPVRSKGSGLTAVHLIAEEESFQMLRWSLVVEEEVAFRTGVEIDS